MSVNVNKLSGLFQTLKKAFGRHRLFLSAALILLFIAALGLRGSNSATPLLPSQENAADASFNLQDTNSSKEPDYLNNNLPKFETGELFYKMLTAVFIVIVLGIVAIYFSRKLLPRIAHIPGREIRIIETAHIGPRRSLHIIKVAHRKLLIAATNETITKLADLTEDNVEPAEQS